MLLLARTTPIDQVARRGDGLSVFLVDMRGARGKGLEIKPLKAMINHNTTEIFFDDVEVPAENLIGEEGKGFRYILDGMNAERILIAAEGVGDARWFIRPAAYAKERVVFDRPIGKNQGVRSRSRAPCRDRGRRLMVRKAAALFDAGQPCGPEANMAKLLAADASWQPARRAFRRMAASASPANTTSAQVARDPAFQTAPISTNLVLAYIAEHVLGLPRSD